MFRIGVGQFVIRAEVVATELSIDDVDSLVGQSIASTPPIDVVLLVGRLNQTSLAECTKTP